MRIGLRKGECHGNFNVVDINLKWKGVPDGGKIKGATVISLMNGDRRLPKPGRGFTLVEAIMSMTFLVIIFMVMGRVFQSMSEVSVLSRERLRSSRALEMIFSRLSGVNYYQVFAVDSSQPRFGIYYSYWSSYPARPTLNSILDSLQKEGFSRFTVDITFMRRDLSDSNNNGSTVDLIPYRDNDNNRMDDFDDRIKFVDANGDGLFYSTFTAVDGRIVSEEPDTHVKLLNITVYGRDGSQAGRLSRILTLEGVSGELSKSSDSPLFLNISVPAPGAALFANQTTAQNSSRTLSNPVYPASYVFHRADTSSYFLWDGKTEANSQLFTGKSTATATSIGTASPSGSFLIYDPSLTFNLVEGENDLYVRAKKLNIFSSWSYRRLLYDTRPPIFNGPVPTGTVKTRSPYVAVLFLDDIASTTSVSGVVPELSSVTVTCLSVGLPFTGTESHYDRATGKLVWRDAATHLPVTLDDNAACTVNAWGGDGAGYKAAATWSFTVTLDAVDTSSPVISNVTPADGTTASDPRPMISCQLSDPETGVKLDTMKMTVCGTEVVSLTATPVLGDYYDAENGILFYTPPAPLASGSSCEVIVTANHWGASNYNETKTWTFTVP
jgi:hypothetical protein